MFRLRLSQAVSNTLAAAHTHRLGLNWPQVLYLKMTFGNLGGFNFDRYSICSHPHGNRSKAPCREC